MCENIEVSESYPFKKQEITVFNKEKFGDVCFQFDDEKKVIHAKKSILSMSSPVFEQMFYGDPKIDTSKPIPITDFTYNGFSNMIKYLYNNDVSCVSPHEIYETYLVGYYYLVQNLNSTLIDHFFTNFNISNCAIITEQFLKIQNVKEEKELKRFIQFNCSKIFQCDHFLEMSQEALIDILNLEYLEVDEFEILEAMTKWTISKSEKEGLNLEEKRALFAPIKNLIRFHDISLEEFGPYNKIEELLPMDEVGLLFVYLLDKCKPYPFAYSSSRKRVKWLFLAGFEDSPSCDYGISTDFQIPKIPKFQNFGSCLMHRKWK